jgi:hypothetical protein
MTTHTVHHATHRLSEAARAHLAWLAAGLVMGFAVPFVFADVLEIQRDAYYALYATAVGVFVVSWARATGQDLRRMARHRLLLAVVLGVAVAGLLAGIVIGTEPESARSGGAELVGALLWRGVVYGVADGLLLSVFPILAVFAAFADTRLRRRRSGTIVIGAVAMIASLAMTAAYHAGYEQFRSEEMRSPLAGDLVWSAPTLVTLNPVGAPIAHVGLHSAAVLHSYETELFLPPH